jgi:hypothetical protein
VCTPRLSTYCFASHHNLTLALSAGLASLKRTTTSRNISSEILLGTAHSDKTFEIF